MIDSEVFRTSREVGRSGLAPGEARNSFGYWIDIPNDWESYSCPEDLILFLGIHLTHLRMFNEIIEDLGILSAGEFDWVDRYVNFYDRIARLLSTTGHRVDLKHDIAETLADWRVIRSFAKMPCRVLDFGAGCGRQGAAAFLWNPKNIYTAIDATLAAYTLQNLVLSFMDTLQEQASSFDFLDFEKSLRAFPDISKAKPGDRFHIPTWLAEANVPEKFYDVIIAAHVHNELSGPDFMRLLCVVEKSLAPDGVLYVRSELTLGDTRDYFDAVDLHGIDLLTELRSRNIVPVWCRFVSGYLTTVFARVGSTHYKQAKKSKDPDRNFLDFDKACHVSARAGENYLHRCVDTLARADGKTVVIGSGDSFDRKFLRRLVKAAVKLPKGYTGGDMLRDVKSISRRKEFTEEDILGERRKQILDEIKAFDPDAVAIASQQYPLIESLLAEAMGDRRFTLRRYYWYPVVILHRQSVNGTDCVFDKPILTPADLEEARKVKRNRKDAT